MAISVGETGGLDPAFRKRQVVKNPYSAFRKPPPFDPSKGHYAPLPGEVDVVRLPVFTVLEEFDDYLVCSGYDPYEDEQLTEVAVAKPYLLRRSPFDGQTIAFRDLTVTYAYSAVKGVRTATAIVDGEVVTETQRITPDYFSGDVILGARVQKGAAEDHVGADDLDGNPIKWLDLGTRAWAEEK